MILILSFVVNAEQSWKILVPGTYNNSDNLIKSDCWKKSISWEKEDRAGQNWAKVDEFGGIETIHVYHEGFKSQIIVYQTIPVEDITKLKFKCKLQCQGDNQGGIGALALAYLDDDEDIMGQSVIWAGNAKKEFKDSPEEHIITCGNKQDFIVKWQTFNIDFEEEFSTYLYGLDSEDVEFLQIKLIAKDIGWSTAEGHVYFSDEKLFYK